MRFFNKVFSFLLAIVIFVVATDVGRAAEYVPWSAEPSLLGQVTDFFARQRAGLLPALFVLSGAVGGLELFRRAKHEFSRVSFHDWTVRWSVKAALIVVGLAGLGYMYYSDSDVVATAGLQLPEMACKHERKNAATALVLLHGWNSGADTAWNNFPKIVCEDPTLSDVDLFVVDYPTFLMRRQLSIAELGRWLRLNFFSDKLRDYAQIHVIAHSMGGPMARSVYLGEMLAGDSRVRSIITIASPFLGAQIAGLARTLGISEDLTADMNPRSEFLKTLANGWTDVRQKPVTYCFTSPQDEIVSPESAKYQCDCTYDYPQWGHIDMVKPLLATDERYRMPIRALRNIRMTAEADAAARPRCFGVADGGAQIRRAMR